MKEKNIVRVFTEKSKSRTGLHQRRRLYFIINYDCDEVDFKVVRKSSAKSLYARGKAEEHQVEIPAGSYVVQLDFRMNPRGRVVGDVEVYDSAGHLVGRAVYRKLKVRLVEGESTEVINLIRCVFRKLKLPVKKYAVIKLW
ncbi:MAG: hypothetical protein J7J11_03935 [Desulfurococcales archaeon]|nr:hypothetical protein [Desulfurococcales archaeon]